MSDISLLARHSGGRNPDVEAPGCSLDSEARVVVLHVNETSLRILRALSWANCPSCGLKLCSLECEYVS